MKQREKYGCNVKLINKFYCPRQGFPNWGYYSYLNSDEADFQVTDTN